MGRRGYYEKKMKIGSLKAKAVFETYARFYAGASIHCGCGAHFVLRLQFWWFEFAFGWYHSAKCLCDDCIPF